MKHIQILGTGCPKCKQLMANVTAVAEEMGLECRISKVEKITDIMSFGVMTTPALVIDGQVKSAGKLLAVDDIKALLR